MSKQLLCGAAKMNITPSLELLPYMFGLMDQKYEKIHDELFVRVMALQSGDVKALIVVYDLDKATNPTEWTAILEAETGVPADNILYLAIHTHTAPLTGYRPFEGPNFIERKAPEVQEKVHEYEAFIKKQLLQAAKTALAEMTPARMGYDTGKCYIGVNRCRQYRVKTEDGRILPTIGIGINPEGVADPTLLVVRIENSVTGEPIAFFTNYAVHCVAAFQNSCADGKSFLSADIGGMVSRELEKAYPGSVALWTSAPAGDINPVQMIQTFYPDPETGAPIQRCVKGEDAAETTIQVMAFRQLAAIYETLDGITCDITEAPIRAAVQWAKTKCAADGFTSENPQLDKDYEIRTHLLQIGPLALIGIDGEMYTKLGQAMKAASPVKDTFIINHDSSLRLNNPGYILDDETLARLKECGGRGAQRGGLPGGATYTRTATVKAVLEEATRQLFN